MSSSLQAREWPAVELDLGMFCGWSKWLLPLPPIAYRRFQVEAIETHMRCTVSARNCANESPVDVG